MPGRRNNALAFTMACPGPPGNPHLFLINCFPIQDGFFITLGDRYLKMIILKPKTWKGFEKMGPSGV